MKKSPFLFVGLGNPGIEYEKTRHNIGAYVLYHFAMNLGLTFKKESKVDGYVAKGMINQKKIIFLLPTTYMNLSGESVRKCMSYYDIESSSLLVLSDDTYLDFAELRLKMGGSSGGHNGLKNIEKELKSQAFARLRIGIGEKQTHDLSDYVLSNFTKDEQEQMDKIADESIEMIKTKFLSDEHSQAEK
ncbi:MAG: Peptidyl-tRNA hydrolase [Chlamydiia bacterium]|nr:Peptidyl-tRNA hydrolase [Chlamydiia bacterium]